MATASTGTHPEHDDFPWMIAVVDHPPRTDSPAYTRSRTLMHRIVEQAPDWILAGNSIQYHHGGSVCVEDDPAGCASSCLSASNGPPSSAPTRPR